MDAENIIFCDSYVDDIPLTNNTKYTTPDLIQSHINNVHPNNYLPVSLNTTIG
jgi:hypothetical protein